MLGSVLLWLPKQNQQILYCCLPFTTSPVQHIVIVCRKVKYYIYISGLFKIVELVQKIK